MIRQKHLLELRIPMPRFVQVKYTRFLFLITPALILLTIIYGARAKSLWYSKHVGK